MKYRKIIIEIFFLAAALVFAAKGRLYGQKADNFRRVEFLCSSEDGFDADTLQNIEKDEGGGFVFAAWREEKNQAVFALRSGRTDTADMIFTGGTSRCILPVGKFLQKGEKECCLISEDLAENMFGSRQVEGQQLKYGERILTVRGLIHESDHLLILEEEKAEAEEEKKYNRINIFSPQEEDGYQTSQDFISRYGLSAKLLRFDLCRDPSWLRELIPGKWSDFEGWTENAKKKKQEFRLLAASEKSNVELLYLNYLTKRNIYAFAGILCTIILMILYFMSNPPAQAGFGTHSARWGG